MRIAYWMLWCAALAVSVNAKVPYSGLKDPACIAPSVVAQLEKNIDNLLQSNDVLQRRVDAQDKEKAQLLASVAQEQEVLVASLQAEIAAIQKKVANENAAETTAKAELKTVQDKLNSATKRAASYEVEVKELESFLANERAGAAELNAELKASLAALAKQTNKVAQLEKTHQSMEKKNKALLKDLSDTKSVELSMASLLSSYYDEALVLAEEVAAFAHQKLQEQTDTLDHVQGQFETAKNTAWDTSSKFYRENLAATLDPILVDVHEAVHPHAQKYRTIVQNKALKAKELIVNYSQEALRRAKQVRIEVIALLEQNEYVAQHAQKILDGILIGVAVPLALFHVRLALRLVWWVLNTTLCVLTCGLWCGSRKSSADCKRKSVKNAANTNQSLNASYTGPVTKTSTKTTATSQKRGKKGKN